MRRPLLASLGLLFACARAERPVLQGDSALVPLFAGAAAEFDVPEEILAAVAWAETGFIDQSRRWDRHDHGDLGAHAPRAAGVTGLPEEGAVRSVARAARLLGAGVDEIVRDPATNVRAAAAILRAVADTRGGPAPLGATSDREAWLRVVGDYFDAGPAGEDLALYVRRTVARGLVAQDEAGRSVIIPSFAELYQRTGWDSRRFNVVGQYPSSTFVAANSGNYTNDSRTAADIDVIVVHTVQGSYAGAISWFQNPASNVSAHYVVRRSDGALTQMVRHEDIAWHAGNWSYNERSIGIEHEGFIDEPANYTAAMMQSSADLARWLCDDLGIPKDRQHIIGHIEVPGATHTDPGPYFDWTGYLSMIQQGGSPSTGTLKGVVYEGTDNTARIAGASVSINPGGHALAASSSGYYELQLPPGQYTISASAPGFGGGSVSRTVVAGMEEWGSVSLVRGGQTTGVYRGVVYDARTGDLNTRLAGATVTLSNGQSVSSASDGAFIFTVPPGTYRATANLAGWGAAYTERTVVAGTTEWGSIGLVPETGPVNRPPAQPRLVSPVRGTESFTARPWFTVGELLDAEQDPLALEIEVYNDAGGTERISRGTVNVPDGATLATWQHPADDLPRVATLYWRARAKDARQASPWTDLESFATPADTAQHVPSAAPWEVNALPGVGKNEPPGGTRVLDPLDNAVLGTTRPQLLLERAVDPEADPLLYQVEVATDDLFVGLETRSPLLTAEGEQVAWVAPRALAPGSRYYVRARAADARVYGPWSPVVAFSIDPNAASSGDGRVGDGIQPPAPMIQARVIDEGGCRAVGGETHLLLLLLLGGLALGSRRQR